MLRGNVNVFPSPEELAERIALDLERMINRSLNEGKYFTLALSGGNTPKFLFPVIASRLNDSVSWEKVHIFWVDERCVPPDDPESNYGMAKQLLLDRINIPPENIHRIIGEALPPEEAIRYSTEINLYTSSGRNLPVFDLILLGLGDDGHTASIFPGNEWLFCSEKICETATHPISRQKRVTITGSVINNAMNIIFIVTGQAKSKVVSAILERKKGVSYPAAKVSPVKGVLKWYLDQEAAGLIIKKT
jgi:6-phosphogluconolactonase